MLRPLCLRLRPSNDTWTTMHDIRWLDWGSARGRRWRGRCRGEFISFFFFFFHLLVVNQFEGGHELISELGKISRGDSPLLA